MILQISESFNIGMFKITFLTLFPQMFPGPLNFSLAGRALQEGIWSYETVNIRDFGVGRHKKVDDEPCGGGNGLIMRPDVIANSIDFAQANSPSAQLIYPTPRGELLDQSMIHELKDCGDIIILCGRFEGVDERVIEEYNAKQISLGDYVLSGGEIAALAIADAIIRLLPGVMKNDETKRTESFEIFSESKRYLEYPLYTKPTRWRDREVPDVLLSGNHKEIEKWRYAQSEEVTKQRRPDLLK